MINNIKSLLVIDIYDGQSILILIFFGTGQKYIKDSLNRRMLGPKAILKC